MDRRQLGRGLIAGTVLAATEGGVKSLARQTGAARVPPRSDRAWPDPLVLQNGTRIDSATAFGRLRRPEILNIFEQNLYGKTPRATLPIHMVNTESTASALDGLAVRKQITFALGPNGERTMRLLLYTPARATGPVPVIVGLNFDGNHTVSSDPGIYLNPVWVRDPALAHVPLAKELSAHLLRMPDASTRGAAARQWQLETILSRGYGLATIYAGDIEPDFCGAIGYGIRPLLFSEAQQVPRADDWGAIGAWGWGMSRVIDVLSRDKAVDPERFVAYGFSRFGKTALWAAAQDSRFSVTLSHESGQAGATLSHREVGESIDHLMLAFPHWFCANYQHYLGRISDLPLDGHLLLALIAPRPLYVGSAMDDPYSDPKGEFLAAKAASPVYALYGKAGLGDAAMPSLEHSIGGSLGYHVRHGGHDVFAYDWEQYLNFMDRMFRTSSGNRG